VLARTEQRARRRRGDINRSEKEAGLFRRRHGNASVQKGDRHFAEPADDSEQHPRFTVETHERPKVRLCSA
jgi:hypothetical protein